MSASELREDGSWQGGGVSGGVIVYPPEYFSRAYLRTGLGLAGASAFWALTPPSLIISMACLAVAAAFAWYGVQMRIRQESEIRWDDEGIHVAGPRPRTIAWSGLRSVGLSYFSTRRDGSKGWMQLRIGGKQGVIRFDSDADGFDQLVIVAMHHAERLGLDVTATTRHNAAVLIRPGGLRPSH